MNLMLVYFCLYVRYPKCVLRGPAFFREARLQPHLWHKYPPPKTAGTSRRCYRDEISEWGMYGA